MAMIEDSDVRNYRPMFVIGDAGVMGYSDAPVLTGTPRQHAVPVSLLNAENGLIAASN
jgi:hypothetical protein